VSPLADGRLRIGADRVATIVAATPRGDGLWIESRESGSAPGAGGYLATVVRDAHLRHVFAPGMRARLTYVDPWAHADPDAEHGGHLAAPMSGTIVAVLVRPGERVDTGTPLVVLDAMKMEHAIVAPAPGRVAAVHFAVGDRVPEGADVVDLDQTEERKP
jgi:biotin carboxyl carrier protein